MFGKSKRISASIAIALALAMNVVPPSTTWATENQKSKLGATPIMGWSSWNNYRVHISEDIIKAQADAMIATGMADVGYEYINIDDGFFGGGREVDGTLKVHPTRFPNGMKVVADYIHSKGLKAGIYSEAGTNTCAWQWDRNPGDEPEMGEGVGMLGYEDQDAALFINDWGYDFLKVDWCGGLREGLNEEKQYTRIKEAIDKTGKDIVYNVCRWQFPGEWVTDIAHSWRISQDIDPNFASITNIIDKNAGLAKYAGPGHFNDMDMLQVGRGMSYDEDKAHFSMWSMMKSPLLTGNELSTMSEETLSILKNEEIIAINQDPAGIQGTRVRSEGGKEVWCTPLGSQNGPTKAVALFNRSNSAAQMTVNWSDVGLAGNVTVRDLWEKEDKGKFTDSYTATVPSHGIVVIKAKGTPIQVAKSDSYEAESSQNTIVVPAKIESKGFGTVVGWIGKGKWTLQFNKIKAVTEGMHNLKIHFESGEARNMKIKVNDGEPIIVNSLKSPGWGSTATHNMQIPLKAGDNTILIYHETEDTPNIDKIEVSEIINQKVHLDLDHEVESGDTVNVVLNLVDIAENVYAQDVTITYDNNVLEYKDVVGIEGTQVISDTDTMAIQHNQDLGIIRVLGANTTEGGATGTLGIFEFTFEARDVDEPTTGIISAKVEVGTVANSNATILSLGEAKGSITVTPKEIEEDKVTKAELIVQIRKAMDLKAKAKVGEGEGEYTQEAVDALTDAIAIAGLVENKEKATQVEVDAAVATLKMAIKNFVDAANPGEANEFDLTDLALVAYYYDIGSACPCWPTVVKYDFDKSGRIDMPDIAFVAQKILSK